uniref:Uncharacterized protein n=1 Tax=Micrurus paraensis TaxID=1970185 RepID=A0A2D4KMG4_9SAUR
MKHIQKLKNGERNMGNANRKERLFNKTRNDKMKYAFHTLVSLKRESVNPLTFTVFSFTLPSLCCWNVSEEDVGTTAHSYGKEYYSKTSPSTTNCDKLKQIKDEIMHTPTVKKLPMRLHLAKVLALS